MGVRDRREELKRPKTESQEIPEKKESRKGEGQISDLSLEAAFRDAPRFFLPEEGIDELAGRAEINGEDVGHIRNALRMREGERLLLSLGDPSKAVDYLAEITDLSGESVGLRILGKKISRQELPSRIILFQGLPKGEKFESILQKAVELGASEIVPVQTARTIVRLDEKKAGKKTVRWNAIALAAAKQSRRGMIPKVTEPVSFSSALELSRSLDHLLIAYEKAEGMEKTRALFRAIFPGDSVGVFIGPEGGFEDWEVEAAKKAGAQVISLGARILRTETAGPAVLSALMLMLEPDA